MKGLIDMIKKHLLRTTAITMVFVTALMTTACGSKQISDNNTTVQQTTEVVKVVSNVDVKTEAEKPNEEADKQPEQTEEEKEEQIEQPEENAEAVNTEAEVNAEEVNEAQNTVSEKVQEEQAEPEATPAEQPAAPAVTTPEEQPAAPAEPSPAPSPAPAPEPSPAPSPAPEPVVTPQETAKPSVTEEQQLVATGKWTKMYDDSKADDGSIYTYYEYTCPITGYSIEADFKDGTFCRELVNSAEECRAVYNAHGITDTVVSFDRLMKLSNS